jgi:hypothetical protein
MPHLHQLQEQRHTLSPQPPKTQRLCCHSDLNTSADLISGPAVVPLFSAPFPPRQQFAGSMLGATPKTTYTLAPLIRVPAINFVSLTLDANPFKHKMVRPLRVTYTVPLLLRMLQYLERHRSFSTTGHARTTSLLDVTKKSPFPLH